MMFTAFLLLSLLGICLATPYNVEMEPMSDEEIFFINSAQSLWKAGRNFEQEEFERVKRRLGVNIEVSKGYDELYPVPVSDVEIRDDLPEQFDSRVKWPNCTSIGEIREQSDCDSSWAFAPVETMTDRVCIHNKKKVNLSAENILACDTCSGFCFGCQGGHITPVWDYFHYLGVVSGGSYNSSEGCWPYSLPPCDLYISGKYKRCADRYYQTPVCTLRCRKGYGKTYEHDKHYGERAKRFPNEEQVMQEIVDNGPVSASMWIYSDFLSYKSGVYKRTTGRYVGRLSIKIIGYGVENSQKYWLVANSWNDDWGDKGFFKIIKGKNECRIESAILAAIPKK